jgi:bacterioferritin
LWRFRTRERPRTLGSRRKRSNGTIRACFRGASLAASPEDKRTGHDEKKRGQPMNTSQSQGSQGPFLTDIKELRRRAREHIEQGAVTPDYKADREAVIKVLNEALATEIVCVLRYKRHYFMAQGIDSKSVADEFLEHANEEQTHADEIARRICQLNGEPNFNPDGLSTRSHAEYVEGGSLVDMIREDLIAERIAIESYGEIIRFIGENDPTTKRLMEHILAKEEEHAEDMQNLLAALDPTKKPKK